MKKGHQIFQFETVKLNDKGILLERLNKKAHQFIEEIDNGVTLELIKINQGCFLMGAPENMGEDYEKPQHQVCLSDFWIGKYAITQEQWMVVMGDNPSYFQGIEKPVENVSWKDAKQFCKNLSYKTGREYRLPSEAEWEFCCRAGSTTRFCYGDILTENVANFNQYNTYQKSSFKNKQKGTVNVGSFPPNEWGLYEMHGNIWEWCEDDWHDDYNGAPSDGSPWIDNNSEGTKVLRSSSWDDPMEYAHSSTRGGVDEEEDWFSEEGILGFRVACSNQWIFHPSESQNSDLILVHKSPQNPLINSEAL